MEITRRKLLGAAAIGAAGVAASSVATTAPAFAEPRDPRRRRPNIVFIMVDEMRFPQHFPAGIQSAEDWLAAFMPNVHRLWQRGVKFRHHYTAGTACSPSRASLVTGLYPHQAGMGHMMVDRGLDGYRSDLNQNCATIAEATGCSE